MPVWADVYANEKQKSQWVTILLLSSPLGIVGGYTLTSFMVTYYKWQYSFYVQAIGILVSVVFYFFLPQKYLDFDATIQAKKKCASLIQQKIYKKLGQA